MVRGGAEAPHPRGRSHTGARWLTPAETTRAVAARVRELVDAQHHCFLGEIQPLLLAEGIRLLAPRDQRRAKAIPRGVLPPHAAARADAASR
jgi:hypothetical protein